MNGVEDKYRFRLLPNIGRVAAADWDALAGAGNPFASHAFLSALEEGGTVGEGTGWQVLHLAMEDAGGRLVGAVPLYGKSHSWGEYIFDQSWARAFEQAGGSYYPKLLGAVPFSPVPGPRLLTAVPDGRRALLQAMTQLVDDNGLSSAHLNFIAAEDRAAAADGRWLLREGLQFHWHNEGYADFDGFLAALSSRKRKAIRKERAAVAASGLTVETLVGDAITPAHWDGFYRCYLATVEGKWGGAYLTRDFFAALQERLGQRVLLVLARSEGKIVAGAFNLIGSDTLYGRNWGSLVDVPFLHFEICYYRALDWAIAHGLARVEAGAQGEHKLQRGYLPAATYSAHWIPDPGFRAAIARFLADERRSMAEERAALTALGPFRITENACPDAVADR